jgi:predicted Zn-ribbon and HTH transcriptional regulator
MNLLPDSRRNRHTLLPLRAMVRPVHEELIIMSILDYAMKLIGGASTTTVTCPNCGFKSTQAASKIRLKQAMLCPGCKSLFVASR